MKPPQPAISLTALILVSVALQARAAEPSTEPRGTKRPNVIIILTDDQGSVDAGCYGSQDLATPHMDALAEQGIRWTQFYSAAPVCSPSRAGLLTGRFPLSAGVPTNCASQRGEAGALPSEQRTIAEEFQTAGYATAHIGKWHLGYTPATFPTRQGFEFSFGHMGGCIDNYSHFFYWSGPNVHDLHRNGEEVFEPGAYFPDLMVREATRFIEQHRSEPFLLYWALNTPHYPYQGDPHWQQACARLPYPRNLYAAFLASQDERIGKLLAVLDRLELTDKTIVVLQSDNGHSTEERAHFGGGSAGQFRGAKFSLFEGGIRVPAIIRWPGHVPAGQVRHQVGHACDWLPTLAELCQVPIESSRIDGRSLVPVIQSAEAASPHDVLHWQVGQGSGASWAVRSGPWKLMQQVQDTSDGRQVSRIARFLSNLEQDPSERADLSAQHPEIVTQLNELHEQWLSSVPPPAH